MPKNIQKSDLSDLDVDSIGGGFSIIYEGDKPVAAIAKIEYYAYISWLIEQVKKYVAKTKQDKQTGVVDSKDG